MVTTEQLLDAFREYAAVNGSKLIKVGKGYRCACPVCGDSKSGKKQRLNVYRVKDFYVVNCFNGGCPVQNISLYNFIKKYYPVKIQAQTFVSTKKEPILIKATQAPQPIVEKEKDVTDLEYEKFYDPEFRQTFIKGVNKNVIKQIMVNLGDDL